MAYELRLIIRTDDVPPTAEDIEYAFDCDVIEYQEEEV